MRTLMWVKSSAD